jgi:DNA repair exonuclease SbcCD ATPase subunit
MALELDIPPLDADTPKEYDYKSRCEELESALNETRSALDEFQMSSRELEAELEKELENMERQYKDAKRQKERLKMESDDWKVFLVSVFWLSCRINFNMQRLNRCRLPMQCKRKSMLYERRKS